MAYYFGKIEEYQGSLEFDTPVIFETEADPSDVMDDIARGWRTQEPFYDEYHEGYWHGEILSMVGDYREIPKADFEVLAKYLGSHHYRA
jgi:hypothetical protein